MATEGDAPDLPLDQYPVDAETAALMDRLGDKLRHIKRPVRKMDKGGFDAAQAKPQVALAEQPAQSEARIPQKNVFGTHED